MPGIIVDIGTGDGKFVYELAKEYPDRLIIGIDPSHGSLEQISAKIYRKPQKGGLKNALFVISGVEDLPEELNSVANQVFINFPWSSLLKGIVLVEDKTFEAIKRICQKGASIDIVFGYDKEAEGNKTEELSLPELTDDYIENEMRRKLENKGFSLEQARLLSDEDIKNYPSSWAKRLSFGKERYFYYLRLIVN